MQDGNLRADEMRNTPPKVSRRLRLQRSWGTYYRESRIYLLPRPAPPRRGKTHEEISKTLINVCVTESPRRVPRTGRSYTVGYRGLITAVPRYCNSSPASSPTIGQGRLLLETLRKMRLSPPTYVYGISPTPPFPRSMSWSTFSALDRSELVGFRMSWT